MNPFDDNNETFRVLINHEGQHSLWPAFAEIPLGWTVTFGPDSRQACCDFVEQTWLDLRPQSALAAMSDSGANG